MTISSSFHINFKVKTGNPHQVKHGNCNLITNKISFKVHYLSEKNDRHLWLRSDKLLYRFCVIGNQISEIEENNMYLESMNVIERCLLFEASGQPRTRTSTSSSGCEFLPNGWRCRS
jgi:hypothetical protein